MPMRSQPSMIAAGGAEPGCGLDPVVRRSRHNVEAGLLEGLPVGEGVPHGTVAEDGVPAVRKLARVKVSYDERGSSAMEMAGFGDWNIDMVRESDVAGAVASPAAVGRTIGPAGPVSRWTPAITSRRSSSATSSTSS